MKDEIIIIIAVGAAVVFALLWVVKRMTTLHMQRHKANSIEHSRQALFPIRMQAYERLAILMERMTPDELLLRYNNKANTISELQLILLSAIRSEYEHNVAQQIYVSPALWDMINNIKNTLITLVNQSAVDLEPDAPAYQLSKRIIDNVSTFPTSLTEEVLASIRKEAQAMFY